MFRLPAPTEGGGFHEREAKVPIHELAQFGNPIVSNIGSPFNVRVAIGQTPRSILKFPKVPTIPIEFPVPELDSQRYSMDGWDFATITITLSNGKAELLIKGVFGNEMDPLEVVARFSKTDSNSTTDDVVSVTDQNSDVSATTLFDLLQMRLKSGDPKYARFSDNYETLDVEGIMAMLTRYLKDYRTAKVEGEA